VNEHQLNAAVEHVEHDARYSTVFSIE